ncbi:5-methylcytosine-specific restriction enzyme A [Methylobacillus rhizosphaerae]|uniref:5-methylcytosine-specific restriction enzyme A n=2 Tax=Methylobacillus rhizosphaerae TaxID=551994 RepID=A0A239B6H7_9PROT|nr:5-methylcytosine-specific restriction enzyme A [Methylobacillus rhizosphaerae]
MIVTSGGRHGKKVGYSDEPLQNGCWWYFGQGQNGDHSITNPANARLIEGKRSILLFTTREPTASEVRQRGNYRKLFAFQGTFNVSGYEVVVPESGPRAGDKLLKFLLVPVESEGYLAISSQELSSGNIQTLRNELIGNTAPASVITVTALREYRFRSQKVKRYALLRANGTCEACNSPSPFIDSNGNGYLEVHHILRLADDGPDEPQNVAAICPNCHRRAHHSNDRDAFQQQLLTAIATKEELLSKQI